MHEIKAYVHANRIGEVLAQLKASGAWSGANAGHHNLAVYVVKGSLIPVNVAERQYSVDLGDEVVNEYKLELLCEDADVNELVAVIQKAARTGQPSAGWIYVTEVKQAISIA